MSIYKYRSQNDHKEHLTIDLPVFWWAVIALTGFALIAGAFFAG